MCLNQTSGNNQIQDSLCPLLRFELFPSSMCHLREHSVSLCPPPQQLPLELLPPPWFVPYRQHRHLKAFGVALQTTKG